MERHSWHGACRAIDDAHDARELVSALLVVPEHYRVALRVYARAGARHEQMRAIAPAADARVSRKAPGEIVRREVQGARLHVAAAAVPKVWREPLPDHLDGAHAAVEPPERLGGVAVAEFHHYPETIIRDVLERDGGRRLMEQLALCVHESRVVLLLLLIGAQH